MNNKVLFQLCYGPYESIYNKIKDRYINYANKYNYDYILLKPDDRYLSDIKKYKYKVYNKLHVFDYIDKYEWLMFIDLDMWISNNLPDLIQYCKKDCWNQIYKTNDIVSSLFIINNVNIFKNISNIDLDNQYRYASEEQYIKEYIELIILKETL